MHPCPALANFASNVPGRVGEQRLTQASGAAPLAAEETPDAAWGRDCHVPAAIGPVVAAGEGAICGLEHHNVVTGTHVHQEVVLRTRHICESVLCKNSQRHLAWMLQSLVLC